MAEDLLQHVQWNTRIGKPRGPGVTEPVSGEVWEAELGRNGVPFRGIAHGRCREDAAARPGDESVLARAQEIVREHCATHEISYTETTFFQSCGIVVRYMNRVGLAAQDPFDCPPMAQFRRR